MTLGAAGPGRDPRALADLASLAEDSGDAFFLEDYLAYQGDSEIPTYDPWICLAAMAMPTTHIRLGVTVTPVPVAGRGSSPPKRCRSTTCRAVD